MVSIHYLHEYDNTCIMEIAELVPNIFFFFEFYYRCKLKLVTILSNTFTAKVLYIKKYINCYDKKAPK